VRAAETMTMSSMILSWWWWISSVRP